LSAIAAPKKNMSAIKRSRQSDARTLKNRSIKRLLKTLSKNVEAEIKGGNADGAKNALKEAVRSIDKAANKGIIHRNTASRKVARLSRLVNSQPRSEAT
jgi:small subunit ribosomal protein S20